MIARCALLSPNAVCPFAVVRMDRKDAGTGRGQGMFAKEAIRKGEAVVKCRPALSVVFDPFVKKVCGFCFRFGASFCLCSAFVLSQCLMRICVAISAPSIAFTARR